MGESKAVEHLSPSGLSAWAKCQASFWHTYMEDRPREQPGIEMVRGTFVHAVLERLAWFEPGDRTAENAKRIASRLYHEWVDFGASEDFTALDLNLGERNAFAAWTWRSVMAGVPHLRMLDVAATELRVDVELDGVPFSGFIDVVGRKMFGLAALDWKTGAAPDPSLPWTAGKIAGMMVQPRLYGAALREMGHRVEAAGLVFIPGDGRGENMVEAVDDADLNGAVATLKKAWTEIQAAIEADTLPPTATGALCAWCRHVDVCEPGQRVVIERYNTNRSVSEQAVKVLGLEER